MKRFIVLSMLTVFLFTIPSCYFEGSWNSGISGNGNVVDEEREIKGFSGIHVSSGVDVFLTQDDDFYVKVVADDNLMDIIKTEVKGDILDVGVEKPGIRRAESKKVYISMPALHRLKISSAGDCIAETPFNCEDLDIDISSAGDLKLEVYAERMDIDISSSGDAKIWGEVEDLEASLSSAGDLDAFDLIARNVRVSVSSAGDASVYATEELHMTASSAGNIYYRGEARVVKSSTSSSGDIVNRN